MHVAFEIAKTQENKRQARPTLGFAAAEGRLACAHVAIIPTGWGFCGVAWRDRAAGEEAAGPCIDAALTRIITPGLTVLALRQTLLRLSPAADEVLGDAHGHFHPDIVPLWFGDLAGYLQGYFSNTLRHPEELGFGEVWTTWRPRLDFSRLTAFQQAVYQVVAGIPRGECRTYGEVARAAGKAGAARAVGAALGANPFPVLIPCHRVIGAGGQMTGFTAPGGIAAKKRMLEMEKAGERRGERH